MTDLIKKEPTEIAVQTGLVTTDDRVERIQRLEDLVMSIYYRVHELKAIYTFNYNRGIKFEEMGPYEAPLDYKLNQLDHDVTKLRNMFGFQKEGENEKGNALDRAHAER